MKINNYNIYKAICKYLYKYKGIIATLLFVFIFVKYITNPGNLVKKNNITRYDVLCILVLGIGVAYIDKYIGTLVFILFMSQYKFAIKEFFDRSLNTNTLPDTNLSSNTNLLSNINSSSDSTSLNNTDSKTEMEKFQNTSYLNSVIENYIKSQIRLMIENDQLPSDVVSKTEIEVSDDLINQTYQKYFSSDNVKNKFKIMNEKYVLGMDKKNSAIYNYDLDTYNKLKESSLIESIQ